MVKIGDTIKIKVADEFDKIYGIEVGQIYNVVDIMEDIEHPVIIKLENDTTHPLGYDQVELVSVNELEALWERLRIMNRSLEEDLRQNVADSLGDIDEDEKESLFLEYLAIRARFDQTSKIMAIVERMMEDGRK